MVPIFNLFCTVNVFLYWSSSVSNRALNFLSISWILGIKSLILSFFIALLVIVIIFFVSMCKLLHLRFWFCLSLFTCPSPISLAILIISSVVYLGFSFLLVTGIVFVHSSLLISPVNPQFFWSCALALHNTKMFVTWYLNSSRMFLRFYFGTRNALVVFFNFILIFDIGNSWSELQSAPNLFSAVGIELLHLLLKSSIWFLYQPSRDVNIYNHQHGCLEHAFEMNTLLSSQNLWASLLFYSMLLAEISQQYLILLCFLQLHSSQPWLSAHLL